MTQNIEQRTEAAVTRYEGAASTIDELAHQDKDVQIDQAVIPSFPKQSRVFGEQFEVAQIERDQLFQDRFSVVGESLPWLGGVLVSNPLQQYHTGSIASGDYVTYLPAADKVPFTTNPNFNEDLVAGRWIVNSVASKQYAEQKSDEVRQEVKPQSDAVKSLRVIQPDLIEKAKSLVNPIGMYYKIQNQELYVGFNMGDPTPPNNYSMCVEYRFVVNPDGLLLLRGCASGYADIAAITAPEFSLSGSPLNTLSPPNAFTTGLDTVLTGEFTGDHLSFRSYTDDRGGMWRITLDNGLTRDFSVWSETPASAPYGYVQVLFDTLDFRTYKYKLEFIGPDPFNPPSVTSARGWLYHEPGNPLIQPLITSKVAPLDQSTQQWLIASNTVPDFAFSVRPADNISVSGKWVPSHSNITGVTTDIQSRLTVDGDVLDGDIANLPDMPFRQCRFVKLSSYFKAKHPDDVRTLWDHVLMHTLSESSMELSISNHLSFVNDTFVSAGYLSMLGADTRNLSRLVYNNGMEKAITPITEASSDYYNNGITSVCYAGYYDAAKGISHGCACTVNIGESGSLFSDMQPDDIITQTWRTDNVAKTYWSAASGVEIKAGQVLKSHTRHYCLTAVRHPNNELLPL
ncbi:hypothetical protein ACQZND_000014 [Vibrio alginolyticus]